MKKNNKNNFLYNLMGVILLLLGSSLFYTGIIGLLIKYVSNDPETQFIIGFIMLWVSYTIFNKKIKILN